MAGNFVEARRKMKAQKMRVEPRMTSTNAPRLTPIPQPQLTAQLPVMTRPQLLLTALLFATVAVLSVPAMSPTARLINQRVVVTGAGRGIGRAISLICSREGARVAVSG